MSYYRTFLPTKEAVDDLRKCIYKSSKYDLSSLKVELRTYCMYDHDISDIRPVMEHIKFLLNSMKFDIMSICHEYAVERYEEDEDKTIWYCGWKYSHQECESDEESTMNYAVENLVNLSCVVKTPDWFDENEKFCDKLREVDDIIEYFIDDISYCGDYEVMDKLKEFDITEKEDDEDADNKDLEGECYLAHDCACSVSTNDYNCDWGVTTTNEKVNDEYINRTYTTEAEK